MRYIVAGNEYGTRFIKNINYLQKKAPYSIALERYSKQDFPTLTQLKKENKGYARTMSRRLKYLTQAVESTQPSLLRRSENLAIEKLKNDYGIEGIDRRNINAFFRFLGDLRERGLASRGDSDRWARVYTEHIKGKKLTAQEIRDNMDYWAGQYEELASKGKLEKFKPEIIRTSSKFIKGILKGKK